MGLLSLFIERISGDTQDGPLSPCAAPAGPGATLSALDARALLGEHVRELPTQTPGVFLLPHPPGLGKTHAVARLAVNNRKRPILMALPTKALRDGTAESAGLRVLASLEESTCALAREGDRSAIEVQARGHQAGVICKECTHREACRKDAAQYLGGKQAFKDSMAQWQDGQPEAMRWAMTTAALVRYAGRLAKAAEQAQETLVVFADEDLMPHIRNTVSISRTHLEKAFRILSLLPGPALRWARHREVIQWCLAECQKVATAERPEHDHPEEHGTANGVAIGVRVPEQIAAAADWVLSDMAPAKVSGDLRASFAHQVEQHYIDKRQRLMTAEPGSWGRSLIGPLCLALLQSRDAQGKGVTVWAEGGGDDVGLSADILTQDVFRLGRLACVLQSDATMAPTLWRSLWQTIANVRPVTVPTPAIASAVELFWIYDRTLAGSMPTSGGDWLKASLALLRKGIGPLGILTRKRNAGALAELLRAEGYSVDCLSESSHNRPGSSDVVIGHYGAHDRGTNAFRDVGALLLLGTYRVPGTEALRLTGFLRHQGIKPPPWTDGDCIAYYGSLPDGTGLQRENHAISLQGADHGSQWLHQEGRTAWFVQAIERIRGIARAVDGQPPAPVYLIGPEPVSPTALAERGLPHATLMTWQDFRDHTTPEGPRDDLVDKARGVVAEGAASLRKVVAGMRQGGASGRNEDMREAARVALREREGVPR